MKSKKQMLAELEVMLRDLFAARAAGTSHARVAQTQGYVDGYMKAMLDARLVEQKELLSCVARQRARISGPATSEVELRPVVAA